MTCIKAEIRMEFLESICGIYTRTMSDAILENLDD